MSDGRLANLLFTGSTAETTNAIKGANWTNGLSSPTYNSGFFKSSNSINVPETIGDSGQQVRVNYTYTDRGCIALWFRLVGWSWTNTTASDAIALHGVLGSAQFNPYVRLTFQNGQGLQCDLRLDGGSNHRITITNQSFGDGEWIHISHCWSVPESLQEIYINGVLTGSGTPTLTGTVTEKVVMIGRFTENNTTNGLIGDIDGCRIYTEKIADFKRRYDRYHGLGDVV